MNEESKELSGRLFSPADPELVSMKQKAHALNRAYNELSEEAEEERSLILRELLGELGKGSYLQGPITFHYGRHTAIGKECFINFNFTVQDDAKVTIGDFCDFGPNVTIVTPCHPMLAEERKALTGRDGVSRRLCYAEPVRIGNSCWIGADAVICPGVAIGDGSVIGAGSVVTRDIPANCFAAGNPARVIRTITEEDSVYRNPELFRE
ncbi:MAG: sugar O-acetyltransferase [Oscillospiraceae bacterium]|nr:sugar O-acetyltransferase [Oscillospiraceae bacterium]